MDRIAEGYVKLVLAVGQHDPDYVDAYYGPPEWKTEAAAAKRRLDAIGARAQRCSSDLGQAPRRRRRDGAAAPPVSRTPARPRSPRACGCSRASGSRSTRSRRRSTTPSRRRTPRRTSRRSSTRSRSAFPARVRSSTRYEAFRRAFVIPRDKLDAVFKTRHRGVPRADAGSTSRCRPANSSRSSTSRTSRGAATTGTRAASAA